MTYDQAAIQMILSGNEKGVKALYGKLLRDIKVAAGDLCPFCNSTNMEGADKSYRCDDCGEQWEQGDL